MQGGVVYLNGRLVPSDAPHISVLDRGFTLGDGVFDTLRAVDGRVFRLDDHLRRLRRSAEAVALPVPGGDDALSHAIYSLLEANRLSDALIRVTVSRGVPTDRGLLPPASPSPSLAITATPFQGYPEDWYRRGFTAIISAIRRNETSPLSFIKSCNYLDAVLARLEAGRQGADEALLLNGSGALACGTSCNIFLVSGGALITPSLDCGVMAGITRGTVLEIARELGLDRQERAIRAEELSTAQEAFVTNTALDVMPLLAVDRRPVGRGIPGSITLRLRAAYRDLLRAAR